MNLRIALVMTVALLVGCGGGGSTTSTSTPNNPGSTVITLETATGTIVPNTAVTLSTAISNGNVPTGIIAMQTTDASGQVTFTNLPSTGILCVSAQITTPSSSTFAGQCFKPFPATYTLL